jgi:hypothetical protein
MFWGLLGAVTALAVTYVTRPSYRKRPRPIVVPPLETTSEEVTHWVDLRLLKLAERDVESVKERDVGFGVEATSTDRDEAPEKTLTEQRERLYRRLAETQELSTEQLMQIVEIAEGSLYLGEGNPAVTVHPMTRAKCRKIRAENIVAKDDSKICGSKNMVALYDPMTQEPVQAKLCIDQFEFPNLPCEYPWVWVRANEAAKICRILDKRLCDAHEWEGACAGKVGAPGKEYESWVGRMLAEYYHNQSRRWVWATGVVPDARLCALGASKSPGCVDATWEECGSNTYPNGAFPRCLSPFGVYDLHGNVAEHMNLPLEERQLGSHGGSGETEMKGSWFAFDEYHPHPHDCRWRAPAWHATPVDSELSHYNYHLGFRCCKDLE